MTTTLRRRRKRTQRRRRVKGSRGERRRPDVFLLALEFSSVGAKQGAGGT